MPQDVNVLLNSDGSVIVAIPLRSLNGCQAGPLRRAGALIPERIPDCAFLEPTTDGRIAFRWVEAEVVVTPGGQDGG